MKCLTCEKEVPVKRVAKGKKTCSGECYEVGRHKLVEGKMKADAEENERKAKELAERKCGRCGKDIPWSGSGRPKEYCSAACRKVGPKREMKAGKNSPCPECQGPMDNGGRVRWGGICSKCHYGITDGSMVEKPIPGEIDIYVDYTEERGWGWKDDEWIGSICPDGRSPKCEKRMRKESVQHGDTKCCLCRMHELDEVWELRRRENREREEIGG